MGVSDVTATRSNLILIPSINHPLNHPHSLPHSPSLTHPSTLWLTITRSPTLTHSTQSTITYKESICALGMSRCSQNPSEAISMLSIHTIGGLCLVPMSCRKWRLVWSVNFALHTELWRHDDLIYVRRLTMPLMQQLLNGTSQWSVAAWQHCTHVYRSQRNNMRWKLDFFDTDIL